MPMSVLSIASGRSIYRGYEYFRAKKVLPVKIDLVGILHARVLGSEGALYEVTVNTAHPRSSSCTCPHAAGRKIICKHMVAVFFTAFPEEAEKYKEELEAYWKEQERQQRDRETRLTRYIWGMKKDELREALVALLYEAPDWLREWFIDSNLPDDEGHSEEYDEEEFDEYE